MVDHVIIGRLVSDGLAGLLAQDLLDTSPEHVGVPAGTGATRAKLRMQHTQNVQ
jgi:hypothetical protein